MRNLMTLKQIRDAAALTASNALCERRAGIAARIVCACARPVA
jgi:hypothetical protein